MTPEEFQEKIDKVPIFFDCELIGRDFLVCILHSGTGQTQSFWYPHGLSRLEKLLKRKDLTWVGFNSEAFDRPLIAAALMGHDPEDLRIIAGRIINERMPSWRTYREFNLEFIDYDHIDIMEVAPGVRVSLKTYAGRMHHKTMIDTPFALDKVLTAREKKDLVTYCMNDLAITANLFKLLEKPIALREKMGKEYGLDLRSKSDPQVAEAIIKKTCGIKSSAPTVPDAVYYHPPEILRTGHIKKQEKLTQLIKQLQAHEFYIGADGKPKFPEFLKEPIIVGRGTYQMGIGGLHSQQDKGVYLREKNDWRISDFDVTSYYPNLIIKCGLAPDLSLGQRELFMSRYRGFYAQRIQAKQEGDKDTAETLKIALNGTYGKLGSIYCPFYAPNIMLAVTLTGQLNLLSLIIDLSKIRDVEVVSANTDGIVVQYHKATYDKVARVFNENSRRTGFNYEETQYKALAIKDVNNYIAIKRDNTVKAKGLYKSAGVMEDKNPTMEVCSQMARDYLIHDIRPEVSIKKYLNDFTLFVAVRNVQGGGVQHTTRELRDDWEGCPKNWTYPGMTRKPVTTIKRPAPHEVLTGGVPFGRVARWYMSTANLPPITYMSNGNIVPDTQGARLCMTLPDKAPDDLDLAWYIDRAKRHLVDMGAWHDTQPAQLSDTIR
jgi:hypothetical protein